MMLDYSEEIPLNKVASNINMYNLTTCTGLKHTQNSLQANYWSGTDEKWVINANF